MWHYPEVVYEKLAMSLSVVCEKGEMKQWRHAKLKSSVEDISRKPWNSDDLTTEVGRRGFNYIMSEHWPSWLLNVDWFTSLFFCKSQTTGFHTTCFNVKVSHCRCRWSIFWGDGVSQETTINNVNILNMLHRRQMLHYFEGTPLYNKWLEVVSHWIGFL